MDFRELSNLNDGGSCEHTLPYEHLASSELRLLTVYVASTTIEDEIIQCSLEKVSLQDRNPHYESQADARYSWGHYIALSYCWGWDAKTPSRRIIINGHIFPVTESLEAALRSIRDSTDTAKAPFPIKYWVDAICINQADTNEREREILRMRDLYGLAKAVFTHLGPEMDDSGVGIELLQNTAAQLAKGVDCYKILLDKRTSCTEEDRRAYRAILKLLSRPYWFRVWILQELAMSNGNIIVGCGKHNVPFEDIAVVARFLCLNSEILIIITGPGFDKDFRTLPNAMWVAIWANEEQHKRQRSRSSRSYTYLDLRMPLLTLAQNAQATDPHDKVYGLLGLMPDSICSKMEPYIDYKLPTHTVFTAFSRAIIEVTGDLDIIFAKRFKQTMSPSWATDWQLSFERAGLPHHWELYCYDQFPGAYPDLPAVIEASHNSRADGKQKSEFQFLDTPDGLLLKCAGTMIGTVDGMAPFMPGSDDSDFVVFEPIQPVCRVSPYGDDTATNRALIHTLFGNPEWGNNGGAALFHIPWLIHNSSPIFNADGSLFVDDRMKEVLSQMQERGWKAALGNGFFLFEWFRRRIGQFIMGGKRFQDYFDTEVSQCVFPDERLKVDIATMLGASAGRRLVTLSTGHFGLAPCTALSGDSVVVLFGCSVPVVLRPAKLTGHFEVVGECYVEGFANGEVLEGLESGKYQVQDIILC